MQDKKTIELTIF